MVFDRIPAQRGGHRYARVLHADEQRLRNIQLQADSVVNAQVAVVENEHVIGEPSVGLFQFEIQISSAQASYQRIASRHLSANFLPAHTSRGGKGYVHIRSY